MKQSKKIAELKQNAIEIQNKQDLHQIKGGNVVGIDDMRTGLVVGIDDLRTGLVVGIDDMRTGFNSEIIATEV